MKNFVVTECTNIGGSFCIAAWDLVSKCMARPMPEHDYWSAELIQKHNIRQGTNFTCTESGAGWRSFPHRTEDLSVSSVSIEVIGQDFWESSQERPTSWGTISEVFDQNISTQSTWNLKRKIYVPENTECRSLGGLTLDARKISFVEEKFEDNPPKLRVHINESIFSKFNLSVTCAGLRESWAQSSCEALNAEHQGEQSLHLRIGLARSFGGMPEKCSVQLNGIIK